MDSPVKGHTKGTPKDRKSPYYHTIQHNRKDYQKAAINTEKPIK
jgi:hypothetical protein